MSDHEYTGTHSFDLFKLGSGRQEVNGGERGDWIIAYGDGGEPHPAQTEGAEGEGGVNPLIAPGSADDMITCGSGGDYFEFRALINATEEVKAERVFDGIDQLYQADKLADHNGGSQAFGGRIDNEIIDTAPDWVST